MKKMTSDENVFIMDGAHVMGDVTFEAGCSIWYGAVLRGDCGAIRLGKNVISRTTLFCMATATSLPSWKTESPWGITPLFTAPTLGSTP